MNTSNDRMMRRNKPKRKTTFSNNDNNDRFHTEISEQSSQIVYSKKKKPGLFSWIWFKKNRPKNVVTVAPFSDSDIDESKQNLNQSMSQYATRPKLDPSISAVNESKSNESESNSEVSKSSEDNSSNNVITKLSSRVFDTKVALLGNQIGDNIGK